MRFARRRHILAATGVAAALVAGAIVALTLIDRDASRSDRAHALEPELHGPFLLEANGWIGPLPAGSEPRAFALRAGAPPPPWPTQTEIRASALWREPSGTPRTTGWTR